MEEKRVSFALYDLEQDAIKSVRDRNHPTGIARCLAQYQLERNLQLQL
jgi:hypothetical protein